MIRRLLSIRLSGHILFFIFQEVRKSSRTAIISAILTAFKFIRDQEVGEVVVRKVDSIQLANVWSKIWARQLMARNDFIRNKKWKRCQLVKNQLILSHFLGVPTHQMPDRQKVAVAPLPHPPALSFTELCSKITRTNKSIVFQCVDLLRSWFLTNGTARLFYWQ